MGSSDEGPGAAARPDGYAGPLSDVRPRDEPVDIDRAPSLSGRAEFGVFTALADPTRRHLLISLIHAKQASATLLAEGLPVSRQAVIKHLHILEAAGLVSGARSGREVLYVPSVGALTSSARWLQELAATWLTGPAAESVGPGQA